MDTNVFSHYAAYISRDGLSAGTVKVVTDSREFPAIEVFRAVLPFDVNGVYLGCEHVESGQWLGVVS